MPNWKKSAALFIASTFAFTLAAGCAAKEEQQNAASVADQADGTGAGGDKAAPAVHPPSAAAEPESGNKNAAAPEPATGSKAESGEEQAAPAPVKKLYKMNKVYRFVPIDKSTTTDKVVLLTFDDGPKEEKMIAPMLDTLDKHKAKAIFFVNGYRVKAHPELLKLIADRGQFIGNHSWDHIDLKKESDASVDKQLGDVQAIVKKTIGSAPVFFRPPFGTGGERVKAKANKLGMLFMTWSDGSLDWDSSTKKNGDLVIASVMKQLHPGANILMHELPWTVEALDKLLTKLEEKGYGFINPAEIDLGLDSGADAAK